MGRYTVLLLGLALSGIVLNHSATPNVGAQPAEQPTQVALGEVEVKRRAQEAFEQSGAFRWQMFDLKETRTLMATREVNLRQGSVSISQDSSFLRYVTEKWIFVFQEGGWSSTCAFDAPYETIIPMIRGLQAGEDIPAWGARWQMRGTEVIDGRYAYVMESRTDAGESMTIWFDASTFLPIKRVYEFSPPGQGESNLPEVAFETTYSDFGAAINIEVPVEALESLSASLDSCG